MASYHKGFYLIIVFCILIFKVPVGAQNADSDLILKNHLKGLTIAPKSNSVKKKEVLDPTKIPTYDTEGNLLNIMEFMKLFQSGGYVLDRYINKNSELKAIVLRPASDEEKKKQKIPLFRNVNKEFVGKEAPSFFIKDINGKEISLENLKRKVIVINFWFINCKPCVEEIPELNHLTTGFDNKDVVFLGLARDDEDHLKQFLKKRSFEYNIIPKSQDIAAKYGVNGYPTHVVIDKEGTIVYYTTGLSNLTIQELQVTLKKLLD